MSKSELIVLAFKNETDALSMRDTLIRPYLEENARLFGLPVDTLLTVAGIARVPEEVYIKIGPARVRVLQAEEAWVAPNQHD